MKVHGLVSDMVMSFSAQEFHFYSRSEHYIGNTQYLLELQIIHEIDSFSIPGITLK
jgi:carbonic anhydrase